MRRQGGTKAAMREAPGRRPPERAPNRGRMAAAPKEARAGGARSSLRGSPPDDGPTGLCCRHQSATTGPDGVFSGATSGPSPDFLPARFFSRARAAVRAHTSASTFDSSSSSSSFVDRISGSFLVTSMGRRRMPPATPEGPAPSGPWPPIVDLASQATATRAQAVGTSRWRGSHRPDSWVIDVGSRAGELALRTAAMRQARGHREKTPRMRDMHTCANLIMYHLTYKRPTCDTPKQHVYY